MTEYRSVAVNGTKIFYHERGSGQPLVLIMGFGADGSLWDKHAAVYEKHFRCIIPDNRGVGLSDQPPGPYTTKMMADDIIAVMDDAGVGQAAIAGISMGGAIAQELTIRYPQRVKSLVLVSTWPKFNQYAKAVYENLKHIRSKIQGAYFMELLQLWIFAPPYYELHYNELQHEAAAAENIISPQTQAGFEGQLDACIHHDCTARLGEITVPTLITVGMQDIFTPPGFSETIHQHIRGSILSKFPDGGHVHHWEDLDRFNSETLDFLLKH